MTITINAIRARIAELRASDNFVRHLQGFAASTADMLEALVRMVAAGNEALLDAHLSQIAHNDRLNADIVVAREWAEAGIEACTLLEAEAVQLRAEVARLTDLCNLMRPVVEAAAEWRAYPNWKSLDESETRLLCAVDAFRTANPELPDRDPTATPATPGE